jgi:DsbE subfamily thiol:disulfide oxidoreductase
LVARPSGSKGPSDLLWELPLLICGSSFGGAANRVVRGVLRTPLKGPTCDNESVSRAPLPHAYLMACLLLLVSGCTRSGSGDELGIVQVDRPLPALAGATVQGASVSRSDYAGHVLVVNFWATWCAPCEQEQPALQQVSEAYRDRGVDFVGVNYRDDDAAAAAWIDRFHVGYPVILDPSGAWADDFGFFGLPATYVVDAAGTIRYQINVATDEDQLSGLLDGLLAEPSAA